MTSKKKQKKKQVTENDLNGLKEEIAKELGLDDEIARRGWANLTSRETGKIGGHMAQKLKKDKDKDRE
ncbi:MAG: small, acid-soluble spore protein, alpha/beta type [Firmicutes bacterium]|nr:small, acid-soluble spore protein, alpha/beta type [Bacillota bacterium]